MPNPKIQKPKKNYQRLATNLELILFAENMSMMLESGVGIVQALNSIIDQTTQKPLKKAYLEIQQSVSSGNNLSNSLMNYPNTFPTFFIKMIESGEKSGTLAKTLSELARQTEKDYELREKIKTAMLYPSIVLSLTIIIGIGISFFILPRLVKLFESFNVDLPITTQLLINFGKIINAYGIWILAGSFLLILFIALLARTPTTKSFWDIFILRIPVIGRLTRATTLSRFGFLLSTLLESGVPIDDSLDIVQKTILLGPYINIAKVLQDEIRQGHSFKASFEKHQNLMRNLPLLAQQLMVSGEESGKLPLSLKNLAAFYEREANNLARRMETILEPILLVIVGIVVTFVALSIITPIYQITGSINR